MSLRILKAGVLTTIQDVGRLHYRHLGINPGGAMDTYAARLTNILAGNPDRVGVLELHFPAGSLRIEKDTWMVLGGADFQATLNGQTIDRWRLYFIKEGSILSFTKWKSGRCAYLAVQGGYDIPLWLGSQSTHLKAEAGGFKGRKLATNDQLFFSPSSLSLKRPISTEKQLFVPMRWYPSEAFVQTYADISTIRIIPGAEWEYLTDTSKQQFVSEIFTIGLQNDRMGYQLEGESLRMRERKECISSAVSIGTAQLLPNGQLTLLMADAQTTGGYPRMGSVISVDIPIIAQKGSQAHIRFSIVTPAEAELRLVQQEKSLRILSWAVQQNLQKLSVV